MGENFRRNTSPFAPRASSLHSSRGAAIPLHGGETMRKGTMGFFAALIVFVGAPVIACSSHGGQSAYYAQQWLNGQRDDYGLGASGRSTGQADGQGLRDGMGAWVTGGETGEFNNSFIQFG